MRTLKQPDKEVEGRVKAEPEQTKLRPRSPHAEGKEVRLEGFGPVLLYSEPSGEDGVRLHLRDDKALLARLHDLPLHDLPDPNIDILLSPNSGEITLVGGEEGLELFGSETGQELSLSPATLSRESYTAEPIAVAKTENTTADSSSEEGKNDARGACRKSSKSSSPNRQGPQHCPVCGKVFGNASALAKHKLTHSDERRYVCSMCAKAFKRQDHLNGHMLTHRNKKPYECKAEGCGKSYCDARSLRRHTENHHSSSGSTPEPSPPTCIQYAPPPPPPLKDHKASHPVGKSVVSSSKPVECNLCHRKFKNIPALNGHMRLHGGYFKKDTDPRRYERRDLNTPPLQTASVSVRALIEEKIILKRITKPCSTTNVQSDEPASEGIKTEPNAHKREEASMRRTSRLGVRRATPDPGLAKQKESVSASAQQQGNRAFSIEEYGEETEMLSPSLQENVFRDAQETVLLEGVDSSSLEESINAADLEDITIEGYQSGDSLPSPQSFQHRKDVRSVLDSPLPANLADFAYSHSEGGNPEAEGEAFTPPGGLDFPPAPVTSSTPSSSYYSPSISSTSGGGEVLLPPRASQPAAAAGNALQSQMMPNSEDPLLSSSPKDFVPRKRFDFQGFKLLQSSSAQQSQAQSLAGIVLDRNGELKLIHSSAQPSKQPALNLASYVNVKPENGPKILKALTIPCKSTYVKNGEKIGAVLVNEIKEEIDEDTFATPSLGVAGKRARVLRRVPYRSRLRQVRKGGTCFHYTPPPMLQPSRRGRGLYWQVATSSPSSTTLNKGSNWDEGSDMPETDAKPHINIGTDYQPTIPDCFVVQGAKEKLKEHLLWDSKLNKVVTDSEVEKYLELACCAAVPGGGRNKEQALHLLHICHGRIQDAMLQLMQPTPWLPTGHPLLTFEYSDCERWSLNEMETFYQALLKYDKEFSLVSREVGSKTGKQCVQFYYVWKKVCPDDYRRLRLVRKRYREAEHGPEHSKPEPQSGDSDLVSTTSSDGRLLAGEYTNSSPGIQ